VHISNSCLQRKLNLIHKLKGTCMYLQPSDVFRQTVSLERLLCLNA